VTAERLTGASNEQAKVAALLGVSAVFPPALAADDRFATAVTGAYLNLCRNGALKAAQQAADDVAIALDDVALGDQPLGLEAVAQADVATGHKIARRSIGEGELVRRYGQVIGRAKSSIAAGDHVHVHNLAMADDGREAEVGADLNPPAEAAEAFFQGIVRPDGRVGTRNYIGVLT
ncbi:hypothetical protein LTR94_031587, partial [Friedmanniomyces endolithicus]